MEYSLEQLIEAKRQIDSTLHKLNQTLKTLISKVSTSRYKSQITLVHRRVEAFSIALDLINRDITKYKS
ncbi:MAG: hypothetical protein KKH01_00685 [Firmicutes bacterium]|nr:hypothetical protein [Bacillota bacterium]